MIHAKRAKNVGVTLLAALTILGTELSEAQSKFAIAGSGSTSCGQYLKPPSTTKAISDLIMVTWIQGYLSGTNTQRLIDNNEKTMKIQPDSESIVAFVDKFCRENPLKSVYEATMMLDFSY